MIVIYYGFRHNKSGTDPADGPYGPRHTLRSYKYN